MVRNEIGPSAGLHPTWQSVAGCVGRALILLVCLIVCVGVDASEANSGEYRLAPGDRLTIVVFDQPQLSGDFIVNGAGQVLLPLAGMVNVGALTVAEAQLRIQERLADGVLVQPTISVRIGEYRPIFIMGDVRAPGSYPFRFGQTVKAAAAMAGGYVRANDQQSVVMSNFVLADERVRLLEANRRDLLVRKARLEAQRDGLREFVMPQHVGLDAGMPEVGLIYAAESDLFERLTETYRSQIEVLQQQRPRLDAEIKAVTEQARKERHRLALSNERVTELEDFKKKGVIRSYVLNDQQREEARVESEVSRLEAQIARLAQNRGDIDIKILDLKAGYERQVIGELQETLRRLREIEVMLGTAHKLRDLKAQDAGAIEGIEPHYTFLISRTRQQGAITSKASSETLLEPGDVIEIKRQGKVPLDHQGLRAEFRRQFDNAPR